MTAEPAQMTAERWSEVSALNQAVNSYIEPADDIALYGEREYWALPVNAGDCEDYVLLKKKFLVQAGFPASSLLITVVLDEKQEGHAVLTLVTADGDYVLDNRRDAILPAAETGYRLLKRQSPLDPRQWVRLASDVKPVRASASPSP